MLWSDSGCMTAARAEATRSENIGRVLGTGQVPSISPQSRSNMTPTMRAKKLKMEFEKQSSCNAGVRYVMKQFFCVMASKEGRQHDPLPSVVPRPSTINVPERLSSSRAQRCMCEKTGRSN
jgi:hypothetical protein